MRIAERFGDNLKRCRERAGITRGQLARMIEIDPTAISFFESGKRMPRLDTLVKLTSVLDCTADELIEGMTWNASGRAGCFEVTDV